MSKHTAILIIALVFACVISGCADKSQNNTANNPVINTKTTTITGQIASYDNSIIKFSDGTTINTNNAADLSLKTGYIYKITAAENNGVYTIVKADIVHNN